MAGFQLIQAFWIVLILAQQRPSGLLRVGVVAAPPASKFDPIDRVLSGGSNAIADLEPTRHDNLAPAQSLATHEHCDESPDAETQIEQDLTTENRPSPSGQKLSATHSRGSSPTGVDMAHEAQIEAVGGRTETSRPEPIHSFESGHVGSSTANPNTEDRALTHRQEPGHAAMTEEAPLAAGNAGRNTHDAGLPTSDNLHNSEEVHDLPSSHQPSRETRRQASMPGPNHYSASHHQAPWGFQLHRLDSLEPEIVFRHRVSYKYLPVYQPPFHPTLPPVADQSFIHAQPMPATHHAGFDETFGNTLQAMGPPFPGQSSGLSSFPDYQSTRPIPTREWNQPTEYAAQWKAKNGAGRAADLPVDEGAESSSLRSVPASTASTSSGSEHHRAPQSPKQSGSPRVDSPTHTQQFIARRFPGQSSGLSSFPDYRSTHPVASRERNQPTTLAVQWKAKNEAVRAADLPADEGVKSSSLSNLPASTASTSSGSDHHRTPKSPKQSDSLPVDSPTHTQDDSETLGTFPNEPSEVLTPSPQAVAEMETRGKTKDASEAKSPPLEGRKQVIDSTKQIINAPAKDLRATSSELKNELGSALPENPVKSALSAKPVKVSVPAHPGSSRDAASTSSKGGDLEESGGGHQVPSNKQLALPLQPDMHKPSYPHSSEALPRDYKPQAKKQKFPTNLKNNDLEARPILKKTGQTRAVASLQRHNRFAALEDSERTGVQKQDSGVAERLLQNEISKFDGKTVQHELDSSTSSDESSGSESDASLSPKMNDDSRTILHPHIASLGQTISRLQPSVPTLRLSFSSSTFLQNVLHYMPSFSVRKSLVDFISNYKSKFVQMVAKGRGHEDHPVPVESQEDLSQAKLAEESERAKGKAPLQTSRLAHGSQPSRSNPTPPEPVKTRPQAEAPEGSGSLNESQRSDSGMSTEKAVPSLNSGKQKAARLLPKEPKEFMPDYLQEYLKQNPGAKPRELKVVQEAGALLRAEIVGSYTPVFMDPELSRYTALDGYLIKAVLGEEMVRQIGWVTNRIGDIEGRRRWKALVRQYNQGRIMLLWPARETEISQGDMVRFAKILKVGEPWPTFQDATLDDHNFAQRFMTRPLDVKDMQKIIGPQELSYRLECIYLMSGRRYPHNWLSTDDMITAYKQGLNTNQIILVGDYLQFGRDYLSLLGKAGVAPEGATYSYLNAAWKANFPDPWGTSAEKAWLLSDPHRAQLYMERLNRLKYRWKHFDKKLEQLIVGPPEIADEIKRKNLESKVWWNLADMIEWQEYHMPSHIMYFIGFELGIPKERNVPVDLVRLKKILEKKHLAKQMKQIIETWFQDHAFSPYDNIPNLHPSEEMDTWDDMITDLAVCWKQKTLKPQHQPLFLK